MRSLCLTCRVLLPSCCSAAQQQRQQLQTSCPSLVKKNILAYVRDDTVPGVNDIGFPPTVVWEGVTYHDPIVYKDFSTRMGVGENVADRGYVVHKRYSWKVNGWPSVAGIG